MFGRKNNTKGSEPKPTQLPVEYSFVEVRWKDFVTKPKYIPWWIAGVLLTVIAILTFWYHDQIVEYLRPISEQIRNLPGGFVIPVVILFILSFPPLFGHEIVAVLCGVVYGLWIGFAIVAAGTFIGESKEIPFSKWLTALTGVVGTWYAFKYIFRRKAAKLERTNLEFGAIALMAREGGFLVVFLIRLSLVPTHFSTAVFSTCDVKFWHFAAATFLTLPKQIALVYVGTIIIQEKQDTIVNVLVISLTAVITLVVGVYVYVRLRNIKKQLLADQAAGSLSMKDMSMVNSNTSAGVLEPLNGDNGHAGEIAPRTTSAGNYDGEGGSSTTMLHQLRRQGTRDFI